MDNTMATCTNCLKDYDPALDNERVGKVRALSSGFTFCSGVCGSMPWLDYGDNYGEPDGEQSLDDWIARRLEAAEKRTPLLQQWVDTGIKPEGLR